MFISIIWLFANNKKSYTSNYNIFLYNEFHKVGTSKIELDFNDFENLLLLVDLYDNMLNSKVDHRKQ